MTATYSTFVAAFPEFSNPATYPESQVNFWLTTAYSQIDATRLGAQVDLAAMLFAAHNITMGAQDAAASNNGATPGNPTGAISSEAVGPVSVGYDTNATAIKDAGEWNYTRYGQRYYTLIRRYCLGGVYVVPGCRPGTWRR